MNTPVIGQPMGRLRYFWWGFALAAIKYNLDRFIAAQFFGRQWYFWNYIKPHGFAAVDAIPPDDRRFYAILLLTSLPFLAAGIVLTLRRLRSAGLPLALCVLFFAPALNVIFFAFLSVAPPRQTGAGGLAGPDWAAWMPKSVMGSALTSTLAVGLVGAALALFSAHTLRNYGWGLFVALPFAMGLVSVLLYAGARKRDLASCITVAILSAAFAGLLLFVAATEGVICLLMAAPLGLLLAALGGMVGYVIVRSRGGTIRPQALSVVLAAVPFTMGVEKQADEPAPLWKVTSSVVIHAPPEKVWPNVVAFSPIPPERSWILHTGVAYPTRARIDGAGVGAVRHCIFSTGEFVEPIEVWDAPRLLRFSVARQPEPLEEMSPYPHVRPAHLEGYLVSREGELRLTRLPGGNTLLEGTTWYIDQIWPSRYWRLWSDGIIHTIHLRVLNHIKTLSERTSAVP